MSDKYDNLHQLFPDGKPPENPGSKEPEESTVWIEYKAGEEPKPMIEQGDTEPVFVEYQAQDAVPAAEEPEQPAEEESVTKRLTKLIRESTEEDEDEPAYEARDYMPIRTRRDGKTGCLGGIMYALFVISISVILACLGWMAASDVLALNKDPLTATITLPKDIFTYEEVETEEGETKTVSHADIDYVAQVLKDSGIIEYKMLFEFYSKLSNVDEKIDPGSYELSTEFDYRALVKKMQVGSESMLETRVTIPEGYTMAQIFEKFEENDICSAEELYDAAANYNFTYSYLGEMETGNAARLEGFLFPDTYNFYQGEQASSVINKMLATLHYKITADMLTQAENRGLTFRQIMVIASMIESEAANDEERATIASVIYNRLNTGMPLQIDATIQYILPERKANLTQADLAIDSPYNTYLYTGLPPGAISNPGMASINAALNPASTNYYYYALNTETGTHEFFQTYDEAQAFTSTQNYG
jgi:UPF0755 protein